MNLETENEELRGECARLRDALARCEESLDYYSTLFVHSPSARLTIDADGVVIEANHSLAELLDTTPADLAGKTFEDRIHHLDLGRYRIHRQPHSARGTRLCSDFRLLRPDGSSVPVMMESVRTDLGGRVDCVVAALHDITARRLTEKALQDERDFNLAILATSGALIIVLDDSGRILRFNQACERASGYKAGEVIGRRLWEFLPPSGQVERVRGVFDALTATRLPSHYENYWVTKNGELRLISWVNSVLQSEDRQILAVIGSGLDITERRRLEAEILTIAEHEKRRIGTDLHDDLGQQLTAMSLMCENLRDDLDGHAPLKKRAAALGQCLRNAIAHTRNLSHGLMARNLEDESLPEALEALAASTTSATSVPCVFHCAKDTVVPDIQIATHLYHIAQEAIANALKHGAPSRIELQLVRRDDTVQLVIRDDGKGLLPPPYTGRGLATMEYRANLMGGSLDISSRDGSGVTIDCLVYLKQ